MLYAIYRRAYYDDNKKKKKPLSFRRRRLPLRKSLVFYDTWWFFDRFYHNHAIGSTQLVSPTVSFTFQQRKRITYWDFVRFFGETFTIFVRGSGLMAFIIQEKNHLKIQIKMQKWSGNYKKSPPSNGSIWCNLPICIYFFCTYRYKIIFFIVLEKCNLQVRAAKGRI